MYSSPVAAFAVAVALLQPVLATPTVIAPKCSHDNCLRQFIRASAAVEAFCPTFTPTAGVAIPTFASNCGGDASRVASACSCLVTATATPTPSASAVPGPYLDELAKAKGKLWFGTAADIPQTNEVVESTDAAYLAILESRIFGEMTPANIMKFLYTEIEQNVFNFTGGDYFLNLADKYGKKVRCHNLVWQTEVSDFVLNGNYTKTALIAVMENHIKTVITHWSDRCYSWDVINEALAGDGTFSSSIWYDTIGPDYFHLAFQFASDAVAATGKDIKLYYNDYGLENPGTKTTAAYALMADLQSRGIRIDGVGLESHFEVGATPSTADQLAAMQGFIDLGLDVAQTELDVRFTAAPFYNATGMATQAQGYYQSVRACMLAGDSCIGTTVWDFADKYSWVPGAFAGQGGADIYDENLVRKPAFTAIAEALQGLECSVCA